MSVNTVAQTFHRGESPRAAPHVKCYAATNERDDNKSLAINIPSTFPPMVYYLGVIVEANANQIEYDETNNSLFLGTPVVVCSLTQVCVQ